MLASKILAISLVFFSGEVFAQDLSFLGSGSLERVMISLEHSQMEAPDSAPDLDINEQKLNISLPVYSGLQSGLALVARGQRTALGERLSFAESGIEIPEEFGTGDLGFAWQRETLVGDKINVSAAYGNAGTRLFSGDSNPVVSANLIYERKGSGHSWFYFLSYSNNRTTLNNIPIPGFAYSVSTKTYTAVFGLPFVFFMWRPGPLSLMTGLSPFGATLDMGLRFWGPLQMFAVSSWSPKSYQNLVKGSDDRLIFDKKDAGGGFRVNFGPLASFSLGYFYNFDRRFILGESLSDDSSEKIEISDSGGFQAKARVSF